MEILNFDYKKILDQSDSLKSVSEKINYLKTVLEKIDDFYGGSNFRKLKSNIITPEERVKYFEKINLKKVIRTKIFLEELK